MRRGTPVLSLSWHRACPSPPSDARSSSRGFRRLLALGGLQLPEIRRNSLRCSCARHRSILLRVKFLSRCSLPKTSIHRCRRSSRKQTHLPTQPDEFNARLPDACAVVFAQIGDHFVVRNKWTEQADDLKVTPASRSRPARGDAIEVRVDEEREPRTAG